MLINLFKNFGVGFIKKIYPNFLDFIYPRFCTLCNSSIKKDNLYFCDSCMDRLKSHAEKRDPCKICGVNLKKERCSCSKITAPSFGSIFSIFDFDNDLKKIVHKFKYSGLKNIATYTASEFSTFIPNDLIGKCDIAVPVPLHFFRERKRGFNQAKTLSKGLLDNFNIEIIDLLERVKHTKTQTALDSKKRSRNLTRAIRVKQKYSDKLQNKNILLIDDVITTTATAEVCSLSMIEAGAKSVTLLSLARA